MPLVHHELCFGCGRQNLFGLLAELAETGPATVAGRCFIKQDHQGPEAGRGHPGLIAAALIEALAFARGGTPPRVEIRFDSLAPVGAFLDLEATVEEAAATADGQPVARAEVR